MLAAREADGERETSGSCRVRDTWVVVVGETLASEVCGYTDRGRRD